MAGVEGTTQSEVTKVCICKDGGFQDWDKRPLWSKKAQNELNSIHSILCPDACSSWLFVADNLVFMILLPLNCAQMLIITFLFSFLLL